jgi:excisionase family DNA binding protein
MQSTTDAPGDPELLTTEEVASRLRITPRTLKRWRADEPDRLPFVRVGSRIRYRAADVDALIRSGDAA